MLGVLFRLPVNNDGVRGRVILVATGTVLQAAAADELVSEQHSPEVRVLARPLIGHQLRRREEGGRRRGRGGSETAAMQCTTAIQLLRIK